MTICTESVADERQGHHRGETDQEGSHEITRVLRVAFRAQAKFEAARKETVQSGQSSAILAPSSEADLAFYLLRSGAQTGQNRRDDQAMSRLR